VGLAGIRAVPARGVPPPSAVSEALDHQGALPARVVATSLLALAVPVACALLAPDRLGMYRPTLWLLALIPVLRMAYYRGWRGAAAAAGVGLAALVLVEFWVRPGEPALRDPRMAPTVLVFYAAIALGITVLAKRFGDVIESYRRGESLRRLETAVETMHLGVTVTDLEGRIRYVNAADAAQHGYTVEQLLGQPSSVYAPPGMRGPAGRRDLSGIASWRRERTDARRDGTLFPSLLNSDVVKGRDGTPIGVVTVCEDITERKRAEAEAERMAERERRLQAQLNQAQKLEAVGRLAGGVAHDFNNILTVMVGEAEMALETLPEPAPGGRHAPQTVRASLREIVKAGDRATALTRQLLAFSRKRATEPTVFALDELIAGVQRLLRRLVGEDIKLTVRRAAAPTWVSADRGQIEQVVMNLAVNARDAMPEGGRLVLQTRQVRLGAAEAATHDGLAAGDYAVLAVTDSGTGMTDEVKAHIFEPFFTTKGEGKGTGLGLATSFGIVAQAGGRIEVDSRVGTGTTMRVLLPLSSPPAPAPRAAPTPTPARTGGATVLLVEDDEAVRDTVARMLRASGYAVLKAGDPGEAIRLLGADAPTPQLLLTDLVLPRMDGRTLAARVRARSPETAVLYMSGYSDEVTRRHRGPHGGVPLLHKPFTPEVLAARVSEVLEAHLAHAAPSPSGPHPARAGRPLALAR
jgi:two-component system cell cycle sensor histidine kinase/response regulator CckA